MNSVEFAQLDEYGERILRHAESASTIANSPSVSPSLISNQTIRLFFVNEEGDGLVYEIYVATGVNMHLRDQVILETLIANQNIEGVMPTIPQETRVISAEMHSDALAIYVNLSGDFLTQFMGGAETARLMLLSITNTLLDNQQGIRPREVFFFIESERLAEFHGLTDFDSGFALDETIVQGFSDAELPIGGADDEDDVEGFDDDIE